MHDQVTFEPRLVAALGRLAELAPDMDYGEIVERATAPRPSLIGRFFGVSQPASGGRRSSLVYLLIITGLLIAALVASLIVGALRNRLAIPLGGNGAITFHVQGSNHSGSRVDVLASDGAIVGHYFGLCPTYSADGSAVSYMAGSEPYLLIASPDGEVVKEFTDITEPGLRRPSTLALSPDGKQVAWFKRLTDTDFELWVLPVDGTPGRRLLAASSTNRPRLVPVWSPDMSLIAFKEFAAPTATSPTQVAKLYVIHVDDGELRLISDRAAADIDDVGISWSPDGRYLAYTGVPDGAPVPAAGNLPAYDVFVVGADGTNERNVTTSEASDHHVLWSPNGLQLAFLTQRTDEVARLRSLPVDGARPIGDAIDGPETDSFTWSPDAATLLWVEVFSDGSSGDRTSTLSTIDAAFVGPSVELYSVDGDLLCDPSWQRLAP